MRIYGVDFTCAPRRAKPITVAVGSLGKNTLRLERVEKLESFGEFEAMLARPGPWVGGFDFPFSLPRELVRDLGWPARWPALVAHCRTFSRPDFRKALDDYRSTRPVGKRYAHRLTDLPAGSSSPMKLVNPPVALMFHEGAPRMLAAGVDIPHLKKPIRTEWPWRRIQDCWCASSLVCATPTRATRAPSRHRRARQCAGGWSLP